MRRSAIFLVFLTAAAAVAAPSTSRPGETLLSPPPLGVAPGSRTTPALAVSANRLLSVWIDRRAAEPAIFGMILDRTGQPLLDRSFRIGAMQNITTVAAASNGRDFLVAWSRTDGLNEYAVRFARVDEQGVVTPLGTTLAGRGHLKLVWSGTRYVLLTGTPLPRLAVLTSDGGVERSGIQLTLDPLAEAADVRMATDGRSGLFITWVHAVDFRVHGGLVMTEQLLNGTFAPFSTPPAEAESGVHEHAVAWNGNEYLIAWIELTAPGTIERALRVRRLSRTGEPLSPALTIYRAPVLYRPHAAWTGSNWVITGTPTQRHGIRVSAEGALLGEPFALTETLNIEPPPVAAADGGAFVVWTDVAPTATPTIRSIEMRGDARQTSAAIASCGTHFAVAWVETADRARIRAGQFQADGRIIGNAIGVQASDVAQRDPAIGCAGSSALVVWTEPLVNATAGLYGSVITAAGASPAFSLGVTTADARPAVAWNGSRYLVAWKAAETQQLILAVLDASGNAAEPPLAVQDSQSQALQTGDRNAAIAWNGSEYFLAWQRTRVLPQQVIILAPLILYDELQTLRLSAGRTRLGAIRNHLDGDPMDPTATAGPPALAASPHGFLLSWLETDRTGARTLKYVRFDRDGQPLDRAAGVALAQPNDDLRVSAAWNGAEYEISFGRRLFTVFPDGRTTSREVLGSGEAEVLAYAGDRPLLVFTRPDPEEGTLRLWGSPLTAPPAKPRRRPAG